MTYSYYYRKNTSFFWRKVSNLIGHTLHENKMIFYKENGSQLIISNWSNYDAKLGVDWFEWAKNKKDFVEKPIL